MVSNHNRHSYDSIVLFTGAVSKTLDLCVATMTKGEKSVFTIQNKNTDSPRIFKVDILICI